MKKIILGSILCLCIATVCMAQRPVIRDAYTKNDDEPLIIVDSLVTNMSSLSNLNPEQIVSVSILKNADATAAYGEKGKNGVIIIKTKPNVNLVRLPDLLDQYNIAEQDRYLKVCKDNMLVKDVTKILLDKTEILRVEVITDTYWKSPMEPGPEERYINIVMKKPVSKITP